MPTKNYSTTESGSFIDPDSGQIIPNNAENADYQRLQDEIAAGDSATVAYAEPADQYKEDRIEGYGTTAAQLAQIQGDGNLTTWISNRDAVDTANPVPS